MLVHLATSLRNVHCDLLAFAHDVRRLGYNYNGRVFGLLAFVLDVRTPGDNGRVLDHLAFVRDVRRLGHSGRVFHLLAFVHDVRTPGHSGRVFANIKCRL